MCGVGDDGGYRGSGAEGGGSKGEVGSVKVEMEMGLLDILVVFALGSSGLIFSL